MGDHTGDKKLAEPATAVGCRRRRRRGRRRSRDRSPPAQTRPADRRVHTAQMAVSWRSSVNYVTRDACRPVGGREKTVDAIDVKANRIRGNHIPGWRSPFAGTLHLRILPESGLCARGASTVLCREPSIPLVIAFVFQSAADRSTALATVHRSGFAGSHEWFAAKELVRPRAPGACAMARSGPLRWAHRPPGVLVRDVDEHVSGLAAKRRPDHHLQPRRHRRPG